MDRTLPLGRGRLKTIKIEGGMAAGAKAKHGRPINWSGMTG
jgi:hypothetical protein